MKQRSYEFQSWVRSGLIIVGILLAATTCRADGPEIRPAEQKAKPPSKPGESWEVMYFGNQRVGYSHSSTRMVRSDGVDVSRTENESHLEFKRFGQSLKMATILEIDETPKGEWVRYRFEMKNPPAAPSHTVGRIEGAQLKLESVKAGIRSTSAMNWDREVKSPAYQERLFREWKPKPGENRSFKTFLPELNQVTTVRLVADDFRFVKLPDGSQKKLMKVTITQSALPLVPVRAFVDEMGETWMTTTDMFGQTLTTHKVDAAEALKDVAGGDLDIAVSTLVKVKGIPQGHASKLVVYRITTKGEDPTVQFVSSGGQSVKLVSPEVAEVTVKRVPIPTSSKSAEIPEAVYNKPSAYLQSNDASVIDHANRASAGATDPARIARQMERYVHENLKKKNFSTALASAAEVAKSLQGDCTEHAVLLAAMLRARNIPSRIAVGLVYVEKLSSFGGHMWTEAWLGGEWVPLDATLGLGGTGAAHLKMGESSFADDAPAPVVVFLPMLRVLGQMTIDVIDSK